MTREKARAAFLEALVGGESVMSASRASGVTRKTLYEWRTGDADFAAAWAEAEEHGTDLLIEEAQRRAVNGVDDFKMAGTEMVPIKRYSDTLLIFLLKSRRPDTFRENVKHEHSGRVDVDLTVELGEARGKLAAGLSGIAERRGKG